MSFSSFIRSQDAIPVMAADTSSTFIELTRLEGEGLRLHDQYKLAKAYQAVVREMGPQPALVAFLNHDGGLSKDLNCGLESMSVEQASETIGQAINPDAFVQMGMENLKAKLDKLGTYLASGGTLVAAGSLALGRIKLGLISIGAAVSGLIVLKTSDILAKRMVLPYSDFRQCVDQFERGLKLDRNAAEHLPKTFDDDAWTTYWSNYVTSDPTEEYGDLREDYFAKEKKLGEKVFFSKSGWTVESFQEAAKWYESALKQVEELEKPYGPWIHQLHEYVQQHGGDSDSDKGELAWMISESVTLSGKIMWYARNNLDGAKRILDEVAHHFEEKK